MPYVDISSSPSQLPWSSPEWEERKGEEVAVPAWLANWGKRTDSACWRGAARHSKTNPWSSPKFSNNSSTLELHFIIDNGESQSSSLAHWESKIRLYRDRASISKNSIPANNLPWGGEDDCETQHRGQ